MGSQRKTNPKIVVVLGPTASGKSDMAVKLAEDFDGEVVSADSRQVYKGLDIGAGKIKKEEMRGIPHHLLDVASPKKRFTVSKYRERAKKTVDEILKRKKLPIICGGTAFYISALTDGLSLPEVPPDWKLRKELDKKSCEKLLEELNRIDPCRASSVDPSNKRRIIRAIEIVKKTKKPVPSLKKNPSYSPLFLGIKIDKAALDTRIDKRLEKRLEEGMLDEVRGLRESGISWQKLESFGLEYRWAALYLQNKIDYEEMVKKLSRDIKNFSKRQMTWWKHDRRINWIKEYREAEKLVKNFLGEDG